MGILLGKSSRGSRQEVTSHDISLIHATADYFVIRRGNIHVPSLYSAHGDKPDPNGLYYAKPKGFELKAFAAWIIGIALPLPGLAYSYTTDASAGALAAKRMYSS